MKETKTDLRKPALPGKRIGGKSAPALAACAEREDKK